MKIRITQCYAYGPKFKNLTPGSVHEVLEVTKIFGRRAYVVMGVGDFVIVMAYECEIIDE